MKRLLLCAAALAAAAGCTPKIKINWSKPPAFSMPTTQKVALVVESDGKAPSATNVMDAMISVSEGQLLNKWVAVESVRNEFQVALANAGYTLVDPKSADVVLTIKPTRWGYSIENKDVKQGHGRLDAKVAVTRASDGTPIYSGDYWANGGANNIGEPEAMLRASQNMARVFLSDLKPRRVSAKVVLDDEDPATHPGIQLCKEGYFDGAYEAFSDAVSRNPKSAPALYDYAVLSEARGMYDQAEELLKRASGIQPKPMYYEALERVRNARKDAQAMNGD